MTARSKALRILLCVVALAVARGGFAAETWQPISTGLTNLNIRAIAVDPADENVLYVGTLGGIFKSTNKGPDMGRREHRFGRKFRDRNRDRSDRPQHDLRRNLHGGSTSARTPDRLGPRSTTGCPRCPSMRSASAGHSDDAVRRDEHLRHRVERRCRRHVATQRCDGDRPPVRGRPLDSCDRVRGHHGRGHEDDGRRGSWSSASVGLPNSTIFDIAADTRNPGSSTADR